MTRSSVFLLVFGLCAACGDAGTAPPRDASTDGPRDALADVDVPDGRCADEFGTALPAGFGRVDGTIHAVVRPGDPNCAMPNGTHLVLQVRMNGAVYRMVVNVMSTRAGVDPAVRFGEITRALPPPAWSEGFHRGVMLDYARDLGLRAGASPFEPVASSMLVDRVASRLAPGVPVSVYAQGSGGASAHIVHRNGRDDDGAIVLAPDGPSPRWMVFHFENQTF